MAVIHEPTLNYRADLFLKAPVAKVYQALTTPDGLRGWWTTTCEVGIAVGEEITTRFGQTFKVLRIENLRPNSEVRWSVLDAQLKAPGLSRADEWIGTTIIFRLEPESASSVRLQMEHVGLTSEVECYEICRQGWGQFLGSLKSYIETGVGSPYVDLEITPEEDEKQATRMAAN